MSRNGKALDHLDRLDRREKRGSSSGISPPAELSKPWRPGWLSEAGAAGEKATTTTEKEKAPAEPVAKPEEPKPVPRRSRLVEVAPGVMAAPGSIWMTNWATASYAEFRAAVASQGTRSEPKSKTETKSENERPLLRGFNE